MEIKQNGKDSLYYTCTDYLGSLTVMTDSVGKALEYYSYDAWGRQRSNNDWTIYTGKSGRLDRAYEYTGHETLPEFGLINMNGRVYDPILGRFLSPDNYVQSPLYSQNYNRYAYCVNNPLVYRDPSGNFFWIPVIIGAAIGAYEGGTVANHGQANPFKWDFKSGNTWGDMLGGAVVGGISGGVGASVATSGCLFANTMGIASGSFVNSVGMNVLSGGQTPISVSFGVASYNFSDGEWGYLGKSGNSALENIGYGLGALANLADINQLINSTSATLYTEKNDAISHSAIVDKNGNTLMSYGPADTKIGDGGFKDEIPNSKPFLNEAGGYKKFALALRKSTSDYHVYEDLPVDITINKYAINLIRALGKVLPYEGVSINCVNMASLSLWLNGIPNIGLDPYLLYATTWAYSVGIRPDLFSYHLQNH